MLGYSISKKVTLVSQFTSMYKISFYFIYSSRFGYIVTRKSIKHLSNGH